ncbi:MAG: cytochrome b/b6 domain-containing protein [Parvibaculum sp.]
MNDSQTTTPGKYDAIAKTLHWIVALFMIVMLTFGWGLEDMEIDEKVQTLVIHSSLGASVFLLMIARLLWRRGHTPPALPDHMPAWQVTASKMSHHSLYFFVILQPLFGLGQSMFADYDVRPFGLFSVSMGANEGLHKIFHVLHGLNGMLLVALVALHVAAALYHHFVQNDTVLKRMLPYGRV